MGCHKETVAEVVGENARRFETDRLVRVDPRPKLRKLSDSAIPLISEGIDDVVNWELKAANGGFAARRTT